MKSMNSKTPTALSIPKVKMYISQVKTEVKLIFQKAYFVNEVCELIYFFTENIYFNIDY